VNAISQFPKGDYPLIAELRDFGRIVEGPVKLYWIPREIGAALTRPVTYGDYEVKLLSGELCQWF